MPEAKDAEALEPRSEAAEPKRKTKLVVTQLGSPIGRPAGQRKTLIGLGLNKRHKTKVLEDTPAVRGMLRKVRHLVRVEPND